MAPSKEANTNVCSILSCTPTAVKYSKEPPAKRNYHLPQSIPNGHANDVVIHIIHLKQAQMCLVLGDLDQEAETKPQQPRPV